MDQLISLMAGLSQEYVDCIKWSFFFGFLHVTVPQLFNAFQHEWWSGLKERKKKDIVAALCGMVHHAVVVTIGVYFMFRFQTTGEIISAHGLALVSPFVFGYLIGDTLFYVVFEAMDGRYEYLIHHIVGIWLVGGALRAKSPEILSFVPHILITEISTFLFGAGWVLRSTSWKTYPIINQLELAFCLTFTLTRVINLPYQVWCAWPHMDEIGTAKYAFVGVLAIQFFWFYKIVKGVISKYIVKEKDSKEA